MADGLCRDLPRSGSRLLPAEPWYIVLRTVLRERKTLGNVVHSKESIVTGSISVRGA